nr:PREDICTED: uncharacterized protein LOC107397667 [Tribolium castaneum]|eukprot:XP_015834057.1 PREDICTED: uncharacterized protein LOC107397667 [Tribolium castaneum]
MIVNITMAAMPSFLVLGVLLLISSFAFILNFADTMTNILKIRVLMFVACIVCITTLLCWTGQQVIETTSDLFDSLVGAPWYLWNRENIQIFLMFLVNCTKNESLVLAGICLDYRLFVSVRILAVSKL